MKVAVFGDPMRDVYWVGTADRLSPEAPLPVVKVQEKLEFPGGAANVAAGLEALGVEVEKFYYPLGCPVKNRLVVGNYQLARWDESDECHENNTAARLDDVDAVVVSDYGKGGITYPVWQNILDSGKPLFVDTKGSPIGWWTLDNRAIVFPNHKEYQEQQDYVGFKLCVLKQGAHGLSLLSYGKEWLHCPARAKRVVSVNGAGDTVLAAFVYKYLLNGGQESMANRAAVWANAAAAVAVGKPYTSTVSREEVERFIGDG